MRFVVAFAVCGAVVAVSAAAQNGSPDTPAAPNAPMNGAPGAAPVIPPPGPYDSPSEQTAPRTEEKPTAQAAPPAPEEKPAAQVTPPAPDEKPAAQVTPPAPEEKPVAETPPPAPNEKAVTESSPPESQAVQAPPQNGATAEKQNDAPAEKQDGATAEAKPPEPGEGRFSFNRVNDGFLRLDTRTGQVSFCSKRSVGWTCQLAPEDRGALENEIARLQEENINLKKELLARGSQAQGPVAKPPTANGDSYRHPANPDLDRMRVLVEEAWRRLVDMILTFQKDVLKKS